MKLKVALIGYGYWGKILSTYIHNSSELELLAIYSPSVECEGILTNDINEIILNDKIDAAIIATPVHSHYELAKSLLRHKKHVFCEKPLTYSLEEAQKLKAIAEDENLILETNYLYLDSKSIQKGKEILSTIDEVTFAELKISQFGKVYPNEHVYSTIGSHLLSAAYYVFDEFNYESFFRHHIVTNEGYSAYGDIQLIGNNRKINIACNLVSHERTRQLVFHAEKDIVVIDLLADETVIHYKVINDILEKHDSYSFDESNNIEYALQRFVDVILGSRKSNINLSIAVTRTLDFN